MKQLTIRGVAEELHHEIRIRAEQHNMSINRYILTIIKKQVGFSNYGELQDVEFDDLDYLAATWSQEEYQEFIDQIQGQQQIDSELWQ
ncbi:MAG: toxin-antitoxin system HicB family antitoxin [Candidatus Promineifilaceae bacterium]|nr:toxin-antitoxin system HicB family antitoxin [Candidatus Promineifilaceae bacterium]